MRDYFSQFADVQVEEHRLEIENRIKNLFWTISGDYTLDIKPDVEVFARSRSAALYDALKQGAFAKYFDMEELGLYVMKKTYLSAKGKPLLELAQLCVDAAVYPVIKVERPGTEEIRRKAFRDILDQEETLLNRTFFGQVKVFMMKKYLEEEVPEVTDAARQTAEKIESLESARNTGDIISMIEKIYNTVFDQEFEKEHGDLRQVLNVPAMALASDVWQDCLTDEQMEEIIQNYLAGLGKEIMSLNIEEKPKKRRTYTREARQGEDEDPTVPEEE